MGQVRERGGVYWIRYYRNGRRHEESARTSSFEKARDLLKDREGGRLEGRPRFGQDRPAHVEDASKDFLNDYTVNHSEGARARQAACREGAGTGLSGAAHG